MDDFEFVIAVVAISAGTFLLTVRMIISAIKWRIKQKKVTGVAQDNSLALSELEEIVRTASLEANRPLVHKIKELERSLFLLAEDQETEGMQRLRIEDEVPEKTVGRRQAER